MPAVGSTLDSIFHEHLTQQPDATMLIQDGHGITYREFDRMSDQMATWLSHRGIGPGDRVAVWLVNRVEWLALLFGLGRLGEQANAGQQQQWVGSPLQLWVQNNHRLSAAAHWI